MNNKYAEYIKKLKSQQSTTTTLIIVCCCFSCILFIGLGVFGDRIPLRLKSQYTLLIPASTS